MITDLLDHDVKLFLIIQENIFLSNEFFIRYNYEKYFISNSRLCSH